MSAGDGGWRPTCRPQRARTERTVDNTEQHTLNCPWWDLTPLEAKEVGPTEHGWWPPWSVSAVPVKQWWRGGYTRFDSILEGASGYTSLGSVRTHGTQYAFDSCHVCRSGKSVQQLQDSHLWPQKQAWRYCYRCGGVFVIMGACRSGSSWWGLWGGWTTQGLREAASAYLSIRSGCVWVREIVVEDIDGYQYL